MVGSITNAAPGFSAKNVSVPFANSINLLSMALAISTPLLKASPGRPSKSGILGGISGGSTGIPGNSGTPGNSN